MREFRRSSFCRLPVLVLFLGVWVAGCATPAYRIKKRPELFEGLTAEQQALVRGGKIGLGFSKEMVWLALGRPDRSYTRKTGEGSEEIWSYFTYYALPLHAYGPAYYSYGHGGRYHRYDDYLRVSYESIRVVFRDGVVHVIEESEDEPWRL